MNKTNESKRPLLRIIGDVHNRYKKYMELAEGAEFSVQVGDMSNVTYLPLSPLEASKHKVIAGNHDILDIDDPRYFGNDPHFLGDFGLFTAPGVDQIFYLRGAFSIDHVRENEEIDVKLHQDCIDFYKLVKPNIVLSHQCPKFLSATFGNADTLRSFGWTKEPPSQTGVLMEKMFEIHQPKLWVFGHYHARKEVFVRGTRFVCLDMLRDAPAELSYLDLNGPID